MTTSLVRIDGVAVECLAVCVAEAFEGEDILCIRSECGKRRRAKAEWAPKLRLEKEREQEVRCGESANKEADHGDERGKL